jgi:hypothetical protein
MGIMHVAVPRGGALRNHHLSDGCQLSILTVLLTIAWRAALSGFSIPTMRRAIVEFV